MLRMYFYKHKHLLIPLVLAVITAMCYILPPIFNIRISILNIQLQQILPFVICFIYYKTHKVSFVNLLFKSTDAYYKKLTLLSVFKQTLTGFVLLLITFSLAFICVIFLSLYENIGYIEMLRKSVNLRPDIFRAMVLTGLGEELFFRCFYNDMLSSVIKDKKIVILISSLIFSLMHFRIQLLYTTPQYLVSNLPFTFCMGMAASYARYYTKNCTLLSLVLMHGLYWVIMPYIVNNV